MNTVVWIMVMFGHTSISFVTGPEFKDQQRCEHAAVAIWQSANERTNGYRPGGEYVRKPFCVRIEK
jgi:hypothetical protein